MNVRDQVAASLDRAKAGREAVGRDRSGTKAQRLERYIRIDQTVRVLTHVLEMFDGKVT